jgi:hypothetical protein
LVLLGTDGLSVIVTAAVRLSLSALSLPSLN